MSALSELISVEPRWEICEIERVDYDPAVNAGVIMESTFIVKFEAMTASGFGICAIELYREKLIEVGLHKHRFFIGFEPGAKING